MEASGPCSGSCYALLKGNPKSQIPNPQKGSVELSSVEHCLPEGGQRGLSVGGGGEGSSPINYK